MKEKGADDDREKTALKKVEEKKKTFNIYLAIFRVYVVIFALCSLGIQISSLVKPVFLKFGEVTPSRLDIFKEVWPHLIYAVFALLSPRLMARKILFYFSFPILTYGMLYYGYISVSIITRFSLNMIFLLAILPFSALPPAAALFLLILHREDMRQKGT